MASSTFPRFQELAVELQLQVWKEAASPEGQVLLDPSFIMGPQLNGFVATFFRISSARLLPFRTIDRNRIKYATTAEARTTLMATCRLSRLAVLEAWWGDIVEISFRRTLLDPYQLPWLKEERDVMIRSYGFLLHKLMRLVHNASNVCSGLLTGQVLRRQGKSMLLMTVVISWLAMGGSCARSCQAERQNRIIFGKSAGEAFCEYRLPTPQVVMGHESNSSVAGCMLSHVVLPISGEISNLIGSFHVLYASSCMG